MCWYGGRMWRGIDLKNIVAHQAASGWGLGPRSWDGRAARLPREFYQRRPSTLCVVRYAFYTVDSAPQPIVLHQNGDTDAAAKPPRVGHLQQPNPLEKLLIVHRIGYRDRSR
jgi:hypothetical protein